jgi:hypothetical protein
MLWQGSLTIFTYKQFSIPWLARPIWRHPTGWSHATLCSRLLT